MAKVRKLASTCLSLLVFALCENGYALGLGEIRLRSHLNEPFFAEIAIEDSGGVDLSEIIAKMGDPTDFEKIGLEPPAWLGSVQIEVIKNEFSAEPVIRLQTQDPIKDPYTNLVVALTWPEGKIVREYTVLLDPPRLGKALSASGKLTVTRPQVTFRKKKFVETSDQTGGNEVAFGASYGPVYNETLWSIAKRLVKGTSYSVYQGVMAITEKNRDAFLQGNINTMRQGAVLQLPTQEEMNRFSVQEAEHFVQTGGRVSSGGTTEVIRENPLEVSETNATITQDNIDKRLKLIAPLSHESADNPQAARDPKINSAVTQRLTLIEEAIDTLKRTNEDITQQNQTLAQQNESLASLLAQREDEINRLKAAMTFNRPAPTLAAEGDYVVIAPDVPQQRLDAMPQPKLAGIKEEPIALATPSPSEPNGAVGKGETHPGEMAVPVSSTPQAMPNTTVPAAKTPTHPEPSNQASNQGGTGSFSSSLMMFLFMLLLSGSLGGWLWFSRERILALLGALKKNGVDQDDSLAAFSSREGMTEDIHFDLEKALAAVMTEEKKFLLPKRPNKSKPPENNKDLHVGLEDAEFYIAYERYAEAEKLLKDLLVNYPQNGDIFLKLLEVFVLTQKYDDFKQWYTQIPENIKENSPQVWSKINLLYEKVKNEKVVEFKPALAASKPNKTPTELPHKEIPKSSPLPFKDQHQLEEQPKSPMPPAAAMPAVPMGSVKPAGQKESPELTAVPVDDSDNDSEAQLSLAQAFIEVGDIDAARDLLIKVAMHGNPQQIKQAQILLDRIDKPL